jgi:hypothetical protein
VAFGELALERECVNVFVFGPGEGEAIALFLPAHGWLFIDACRRRFPRSGEDVIPQLALRRALGADDHVFGVLLTHPHEDHADGFADLVRTLEPARVFVTGTISPARDLVRATELSLARSKQNVNDTRRRRLAQVVHQGAVAIRQWEEDTTRHVEAVHAGVVLLDAGGLRVECVAPAAETIPDMLDSDQLATKANHMSVVLVVTFGEGRLVLTGDLPWVATGTQVMVNGEQTRGLVPSGWERVVTHHDVRHHALKVPHHGSREALHPRLLGRDERDAPARRWIVTPKNGSSLPKFWGGASGVDTMLEHEASILLSALPSSWVVDGAIDPERRVARAQLRRRASTNPTGDAFVDESDDIRPRDLDPREAVWALSLGRDGTVRRTRGSEAVEVHRA